MLARARVDRHALLSGALDHRRRPSSICARSGELWSNLSVSLIRLFWGYLLGGIPALLLGLAMGLYRPVRAIVDPLVAATYPVPKSAILPLVLLVFGLGEASKIVMVALGVFYPVLINTTAGVLQIDRIYLDVGKNFGASRWQIFRTIALPGAAPLIMAGVKLGVGLGLILIAIAEMIGAQNGIGFMIWNAWQLMSVDTMFVGLIVIALLGFAFNVGARRARALDPAVEGTGMSFAALKPILTMSSRRMGRASRAHRSIRI